MRRTLVIGLMILVSGAVLAGARAWHQRLRVQQTAVVATAPANTTAARAPIPQNDAASAAALVGTTVASAPIPQDAAAIAVAPVNTTVVSAPIPQDAAAIAKRRHDRLEWNRRTLQGAYDQVGKKDPRWDELARTTFDLAARTFSQEVDPEVTFYDVYPAARAAVDAGCDDPMLAYLYARTSVGANYPGLEEAIGRARAAAQGLAASRYPAIRRAVALRFSGGMLLSGKDPGDANRKEAEGNIDAALALLEASVAGDEQNEFWEANWLDTLIELTRGYRTLGVPAVAAYERVDAGLARVADAKVLRLVYRGVFWFGYGWEARTQAFAPGVPAGGFDSLEKRLAIAREAFEDAWKLQPGSGEVARRLIEIDKAVGGDRATMELWFERAMKANGDDRTACWSKLDWLDPKWHGSVEDMLAFGRACRDTKNSRTGITLLVADAHFRIAGMAGQNQIEYMKSPEVWADIQSVYDEYLKHTPVDDVARSKFATLCYLSGHFREAEVQYVALGGRLTQWSEFPYVPYVELKQNREHTAKILMNKASRVAFPGWHFVGGKTQDGQWKVNVPVGAEHKEKPGMLGADKTHIWTCAADGVSYELRVMRLPPALRNDRPERVLEALRAVVAKERGAPPRDLRDTLLAARPAQEYYVDAPALKPMHLRVKTIVIDTWLYELSVTASASAMTGRSAQEFFDSFAFQPTPKASPDAGEP